MPTPKISVCLDVFNYAKFLPQSIESVLSQTCGDFELIIADDCSTDGSFEIAQSYTDSRIRLIRNAKNEGMVQNRNAALKAARGGYIKPLHADDFLCSPETLAKMAELLDDVPGMSLAASRMRFVNAAGDAVGSSRDLKIDRPIAGTNMITRCLREQRNLIGPPSAVMFRRARSSRGFEARYFHMADLEMWFHLLEQGCFGFLAEPLCAYRQHDRQQTIRDRATLSEADDYDALLGDYLDRNYVSLRLWEKRQLRRMAHLSRWKRLRALKLPAATPSWKVRLTGALVNWASRQRRFLKRTLVAKLPPSTKSLPVGINLVGFFAAEFGIGDAGRALQRAVEASGLPSSLINLRNKVHRNEDQSLARFSKHNPFAVNLMAFSFDHARRFSRDTSSRFFANRYNIALWYWELEKLPPRWHACFDYYDEVWVTTEFCRQAIAEVSPLPVRKIAPPLIFIDATPDRPAFALQEDTFVFMFSFDHLSLIERKNPLGVINAFKKAFPSNKDALLVLKSTNATKDRSGSELLQQASKGYNILFIKEHLRAEKMAALFASIDCYVSLHRSEGLGLGMAQAMSAAKPVIATDYSGNLEFMNQGNSLLVQNRLVEIEKTSGPYERGYLWAEPSIEHAAELMRWTYEHREEARKIGLAGAASVRKQMDPVSVGRQIRARILEVVANKH